MTVQNLYTQYLDGKITESKFLYEVRRDQNLNMISPTNSFKDVIQILKNKSIISEEAHKESKTKKEIETVFKTIDMVNPYEYSKGLNYELKILDIPASYGNLENDNILKVQKTVLANLTKNPQYYSEKINGKGEVSDKWVEATKKEIEKIGKGKSKIIRENKENGMIKFFYLSLSPYGSKEEIKQYISSVRKSKTDFEDLEDYIEDFKNYIADKSLEEGFNIKKFTRPNDKQLVIYEKYSQQTGIPIDNLMAMVREAKEKKIDEAIALKDKAGNIQYAKDSTEASNIERNAKTKGIILTKSNV